jgi:hypothetical protein
VPQGAGNRPEGLTFRGVPRVLWRWKWVVLGVAALATLGAYGLALQQTPMYRATAGLIYQPPIAPGNQFITPVSQPSPQAAPAPALYSSAADIASNPAVVARAERILGGTPRPPYRVSAELVGGGATSVFNGRVVNHFNVSATSPSATESVDVANAFGRAIAELSKEQRVALITKAEQVLRDRLKAFSTPQSRRSPDYLILRRRLQELEVQAATATGYYQVVLPATAPAGPYTPHPTTAATVGLLGGLVAGIALALVLETFRTRPKGRRDVSHSPGTLGSSVTP